MQKEWFINNSNQLNVFRMIISPIFRSTRLCVAACGIMHPRCCRPVTLKRRLPGYRPATSWILYKTSCNTQSSAPEDGQNYRPKHVELTGIINKPLLLPQVGCLYYLYRSLKLYPFTVDQRTKMSITGRTPGGQLHNQTYCYIWDVH